MNAAPRAVTGLAAVVGGALLAVVAFAIASGPLGIDVVVPAGPGGGEEALTAPRVALLAAIGGVVGLLLAVLAERRADDPRRWWLRAVAIGLVLSFVPSIAVDAGSVAATVTLLVLHVLVAAAVVPVVAATLPTRRPRGS